MRADACKPSSFYRTLGEGAEGRHLRLGWLLHVTPAILICCGLSWISSIYWVLVRWYGEYVALVPSYWGPV